jgi:hypothetical protein
VKFIWVVTSCEGRPTADVIAHYYELHYQNKKVHLHGSETTFVAQFGCISFQPSRFGDRARPALAMRNKWSTGWDGNWFYCQVPAERMGDGRGKGNYLLSSIMTPLTYFPEAPSFSGPDDTNDVAFVEATSIIGNRDAMEEFLACRLWPFSENFGFDVEMKETPLSKVVVPMTRVTAVIMA